MTCTQALLSLFMLMPCNDGGGGHEAVQAAVANAARPEADVARDAGRKPGDVLDFLGITPGMTVLEVFAGGGYYTQILDAVVGPDGKVLAHNNQGYLAFVGEQFNSRFADGGLANTEKLLAEANDIALAPASLDAVLMVLTWHDFLFGNEEYQWPDVDEGAFVGSLCDAMKPGAVLGVIDHIAAPGGDANDIAFTLHRIDPEIVKAALADTCLELTAESGILRNPEDDRATPAIKPELQGKTDRFILKFERN